MSFGFKNFNCRGYKLINVVYWFIYYEEFES